MSATHCCTSMIWIECNERLEENNTASKISTQKVAPKLNLGHNIHKANQQTKKSKPALGGASILLYS